MARQFWKELWRSVGTAERMLRWLARVCGLWWRMFQM
jgi:hypothetical protein